MYEMERSRESEYFYSIVCLFLPSNIDNHNVLSLQEFDFVLFCFCFLIFILLVTQRV